MLEQALLEEKKKREYRKMRRLYGFTDERTQIAKIRYLQMKDDPQWFICKTLHAHNGIVMQKLKEDGSKKRMFDHIKNDEQEVVKEVERFWGNLFCTNGKVTLG